jgi:single-stranded-DNA-specific exonuclease
MPDSNDALLIVERACAGMHDLGAALPRVLARIYSARGVSAASELDLSLSGLLQPETLTGAGQAARIIAEAVLGGRHIKIVGDFDADGATATAVAMKALRAFGAARVSFLVPNRFEFGYGLTPEIVELARRDAPDLLVTVDNGVSSVDGVRTARAHGMAVVITDHHLPGRELPDADAIANPNLESSTFPSKALAGVGVIFYVMGLARRVLRDAGWFSPLREEPNLSSLLDLVALGTVADVVPLDRNNRILVQQGLRRIRAGKACAGIRALCEVAGRPTDRLTAQDLAFALGPRLNAAGRLDDMSIGIRCLLADDLKEARTLATALHELNEARRAIERRMTDEAELRLSEIPVVTGKKLGLCLYDPTWHAGVVGIVAGRLREKHHRPAIAFADAGNVAPDEIRGSARSVPGVHIRDALDAIAARYPGLVTKFGGHAMAAGVSIRRVHFDRFASAFAAEVARWITEDDVRGVIFTDGVLSSAELALETAQLLADTGPWGQGFPEPLFHGDFELVTQRTVGERHTRMVLRAGDRLVDAIAFNAEPPSEKRFRAVYSLSLNEYRDVATLQLVVRHMIPICP